MNQEANRQWPPLAAALTRRTEKLCIGLEHGVAYLYELVTAELLRWWFSEDACASRGFNFHPGQRQTNRHDFARVRYVKDDGMPALYFPDFLVHASDGIYLVETKAQQQVNHPNVQRKLKAATTWCERINALDAHPRGDRTWRYVPVGKLLFHDWRKNGARPGELLAFSRARRTSSTKAQGGLAFGD